MKKIITLIAVVLVLVSCQTKNPVEDTSGPQLAFHEWAPTPPLGWNSWDCYGPTVVEDEVKANADYMAKYLKKGELENIVVDIRWYLMNDKSGVGFPGQGPNPQAERPNNGKFLVFIEDPAGPEPSDMAEITVKFEELGLTGTHTVKDLWSGEKLGKFTGEFSSTIKRHGAGLYRIH